MLAWNQETEWDTYHRRLTRAATQVDGNGWMGIIDGNRRPPRKSTLKSVPCYFPIRVQGKITKRTLVKIVIKNLIWMKIPNCGYSSFPVPSKMFWYVFKFTMNWTSFCLWLLQHKIFFAICHWSPWSPPHHKWSWTNKMVVIFSSLVLSILSILFKLYQHYTSIGWICFGSLFSLVYIILSRGYPWRDITTM